MQQRGQIHLPVASVSHGKSLPFVTDGQMLLPPLLRSVYPEETDETSPSDYELGALWQQKKREVFLHMVGVASFN